MSNIFVTEIVGSNTYAIPTDDTELAAATAGLDLLLGAVLDLTYDRVLAWVEDSGGPGAVEGVRSLNCMIEKFTYLTEECPSESDVDSMILAIETVLEADSDITSVGNQQVHIFQAGAYFLWNRDASGGFLYPNAPTDDVAVGPFASPTGKWFNDGDLVLGGNVMSGTEVLRVVGDALVEGIFEAQRTDINTPYSSVKSTITKNNDGDQSGWAGYEAEINHDVALATAGASVYRGFLFDLNATSSLGSAGVVLASVRGLETNISIGVDVAVTLYRGVFLIPPTGSGSIVTSYGVYVGDQGLSSTTTYGIYIEAQTGSTKYGLYCNDDVYIDGKLTVTGLIDPTGLVLDEQSATPYDPTSTTKGTIWVRDDTPNVLVFTDNAGTDTVLGGGSGSSPWTNTGTVVHLVTATDTVAIGAAAMTGTEKLRVIGDVLVEADGSSLGNVNLPAGNALATQGGIDQSSTNLIRRHLSSIYIGNSGYISGTANHTDCIAIGEGAFSAAYDNTARVIAIGTNAAKGFGFSNTDAVIIGYKAAETPARATHCVVIGNNAAQSAVATMDLSVIIGDGAALTGSGIGGIARSVVIGANAAQLLYTTNESVLIGYNVTAAQTSGAFSNTIVGAQAGSRITNGDQHVFLGHSSGNNINTALASVAIGYLAMGNASAGRSGGGACVAVGHYAMADYFSSSSNTGNTAVGAYALQNTSTSATTFIAETTAIGFHCAESAYNASYCVYIGSYAGQTNHTSHRLYIGTTSGRSGSPLIYGEFDNYLFQVNGKLSLAPLVPATKAPLSLAELSAAPAAPVANDIYLDDGTNTGSGSPGWRRYTGAVWEDIGAVAGSGPWTSASGVIYPSTLTDTVAINSTAMSATANEYLFVKDDDETAATRGVVVELEKNDGTAAKTSWTGVEVDIEHSGTNGATSYIGFDSSVNFTPAGAYTIGFYTAFKAETVITDASAVIAGFTGISIEGPTGSGTLTTSIGVNIGTLAGTSSSWGVFQTGSADQNFFAGDIGVNFSTYGAAQGRIHVYQADVALKNANIYSIYDITAGFASHWNGIESSLIFTTSTDTSSTKQRNFTSTVEMNGTGDADRIYGFYSSVDGSNAAGVVTYFTHFCATYPVTGTATATNIYGLYVDDISLNSTTAYGVYIADQTATNSWGIYQVGADDLNYFGGHIGIAVTPDASNYLYVQDNEETATRAGVRSECIKDDANNGKIFTAFQGVFTHTGTGGVDQVRGFGVTCSQSNTGDIAAFDGLYVSASSSASGGVIGTFRGAYINGTVTTGQITNAYGIYIASMEGTTLSYGIYQSDAGDDNYFAGNVGIGDDTPSYALDVSGDVRITDQLGVGTTPTTDNGITVEFATSGTGSFNGVEALVTKTSTGTVSGAVFGAKATVDTGTASDFSHFRAYAVGGTGGTFSAVYGLFIENQYSASNPTATNTYGIYQYGTSDQNYFAGATLFGTSGTIDPAAIVEFSSTTKGVLFPRMTSDPSSPPDGLVYYNSSTDKLRLRANGAWVDLN